MREDPPAKATNKRMSIKVLVFAKPSKKKTLKNPLALRESLVIAYRPTVCI
jgi:hypothetical protein